MAGFTEGIASPFQVAWMRVAEQIGILLPKVVVFILILIIGWLIAKILIFIIRKILTLIKLNVLSEKAGIESYLKKGNIQKTFVDILCLVLYWFFLFIVFLVAFDAVGLAAVSVLLNRVLLYIPNVVVALIIMVIGFYLAKLLSVSAKVFTENIGFTRSDIAAKVVNIVILLFVFSLVLEQLGIGKEIITTAFTILLGTLGLGIAIAIGLGSKDYVIELWKKYKSRPPAEK